jgi:hypothetical protein
MMKWDGFLAGADFYIKGKKIKPHKQLNMTRIQKEWESESVKMGPKAPMGLARSLSSYLGPPPPPSRNNNQSSHPHPTPRCDQYYFL